MATETAGAAGRTLIYDGLAFGECPRWHDGRLWLSDIFGKRVVAVDLDGNGEEICSVENHPSGLGWLPDGRLLVVSMTDRRLLRLEPEGLVEHADVSAVCPGNCNDMVVDAQSHMGRLTAYAIANDGSLQGERVFADLPAGRNNPDGICIDADGAVWYADPHHCCCVRVLDGGQLTH